MDVLIQTTRASIEHKMEGNAIEGSVCWWNVNGKPRRCSKGDKILFSDGDEVFAEGTILDVKEGEIIFTPLEGVSKENPEEPPSRGFKYLGEAVGE